MQKALEGDAVEVLRDGVDTLLALDLLRLDGVAVASLLEAVEVQRRRLDALDGRLAAAAEDRRITGEYADCSLTDLLMHRLHLDAREARKRAARAEDVGPRRTLLGEPLEPILPLAATALETGEISGGHVEVISRATRQIDDLPAASPETVGVVERLLVDAARHERPSVVARLGQELLARLDPDGSEPRDARLERQRSWCLQHHPDASSSPHGRLTPELTLLMDAVVEALAAAVTGPNGEADERTPGQRRHDALLEVFTRVLRGDLATAGGIPLTAIVRYPVDQAAAGMADSTTLEWDAKVPAEAREKTALMIAGSTPVERVADVAHAGCGMGFSPRGDLLSGYWLSAALCESEIDTAVSDVQGGLLAFGRTKRRATPSQRLALAARDGGCTFPGCTRPPAWCEAHHVIPWQYDGPTDIDNLCLLCAYHHRRFERLGWFVVMRGGVAQWIPPPWFDSEQRPVRNRAHHLDDERELFASFVPAS